MQNAAVAAADANAGLEGMGMGMAMGLMGPGNALTGGAGFGGSGGGMGPGPGGGAGPGGVAGGSGEGNGRVWWTACTETVHSQANPIFQEKTASWRVVAPCYRARLVLEMVEAQSSRVVGTAVTSVMAIVQGQADAQIAQPVHNVREALAVLRASSLATAVAQQKEFTLFENGIDPITGAGRGKPVGYVCATVSFEEDMSGLFYSDHPRLAPKDPEEEQVQVEMLKRHVGRMREFVRVFSRAFANYRYVMNWENPWLTGALLLMFVHVTLTINAEYALCVPFFAMVFYLSFKLFRRRTGHFRKKWVEHNPDAEDDTVYRPVAHLRLSVTGYHNLEVEDPQTHRFEPPFVKVTYLPDGVPLVEEETPEPQHMLAASEPGSPGANARTASVTRRESDPSGPGDDDHGDKGMQYEDEQPSGRLLTAMGSYRGSSDAERAGATGTGATAVGADGDTAGDGSVVAATSQYLASQWTGSVLPFVSSAIATLASSSAPPTPAMRRRPTGSRITANGIAMSSGSAKRGSILNASPTMRPAVAGSGASAASGAMQSLSLNGGGDAEVGNPSKGASAGLRGGRSKAKRMLRTASSFSAAVARGAPSEELLIACTRMNGVPMRKRTGPGALGVGVGRAMAGNASASSFWSTITDAIRGREGPQDGLLHNVTTAWPRPSGKGEDTAYIYPILQAVQRAGDAAAAAAAVAAAAESATASGEQRSGQNSEASSPHWSPNKKPAPTPSPRGVFGNPAPALMFNDEGGYGMGMGASSMLMATTQETQPQATLAPDADDQDATVLSTPARDNAPVSGSRSNRRGIPTPRKSPSSSPQQQQHHQHQQRGPGQRASSWNDANSTEQSTTQNSKRDSDTIPASSGRKPRRRRRRRTASEGSEADALELIPWREHPGVVKLTIYGENPFDSFIDNPWAEVYIPILQLLSDGGRHGGGGGADGEEDGLRRARGCSESEGAGSLIAGAAGVGEGHKDGDGKGREELGGPQLEHEHWMRVHWLDESMNPTLMTDSGGGLGLQTEDAASAVRVRVQLDLPPVGKKVTEEDRETSRVIQRMLDGSPQRQESSLSTIWHLRDNVVYVQNLLNRILNLVEAFRNIFNWTHPHKTIMVYLGFLAVWLLFVLVPGRWIILCAGVHEFIYKFLPKPEDLPMSTRFSNMLRSIPSDADLSFIYAGENEQFLRQKRGQAKERERRARLRVVFDCRWEGHVQLRVHGTRTTTTSASDVAASLLSTAASFLPPSLGGTRNVEDADGTATNANNGKDRGESVHGNAAEPSAVASAGAGGGNGSSDTNAAMGFSPVYLVAQGPRLVWWETEHALEQGMAPAGQLLLHGHAGVTHPSPIELRELGGAAKNLVVVFGRDAGNTPTKITVIVTTPKDKENLESAVLDMMTEVATASASSAT